MFKERKVASMSTQFGQTFTLLLSLSVVVSAGVAAEASRPSAADLHDAYESGVVFVDVRTDAEWSVGFLKNAVHLPLDEVGARAASLFPAKDAPLVLYCRTGRRAESAAEQLRQLGYTHVSAMVGGYDDLKWRDSRSSNEGVAWSMPSELRHQHRGAIEAAVAQVVQRLIRAR